MTAFAKSLFSTISSSTTTSDAVMQVKGKQNCPFGHGPLIQLIAVSQDASRYCMPEAQNNCCTGLGVGFCDGSFCEVGFCEVGFGTVGLYVDGETVLGAFVVGFSNSGVDSALQDVCPKQDSPALQSSAEPLRQRF